MKSPVSGRSISFTAQAQAEPSIGDLNCPPSRCPLPEEAQIIARTFEDGTHKLHYLEVNGVRLLTPLSPHLSRREINVIVAFAAREKIESVMIADTVPSKEISSLISKLRGKGVEVIFKDHHKEPVTRGLPDLMLNHSRLQDLLGANYESHPRDAVPSVSHLIPPGSLVLQKIGLYLASPPDADGIVSGLVGAGLDPGRANFEGEMATCDALAVLDSPGSPRAKIVRERARQDIKQSGKVNDGVSLPVWLQEFNHGLKLVKHDPLKTRDLQLALALTARDGHLSGPGGEELDKLELAFRRRQAVVKALLESFGKMDGPFFTFDLEEAKQEMPRLQGLVFKDKADLAAAYELLQPGPLRMAVEECKGALRELNQRRHSRVGKDFVLILKRQEGALGLCADLLALGRYALNKEDGGVNFRAIVQECNYDRAAAALRPLRFQRCFTGAHIRVAAEDLEAVKRIIARRLQEIRAAREASERKFICRLVGAC